LPSKLQGAASFCLPNAGVISKHHHIQLYYTDDWELNSGPHAHAMGTLLTEPSSQPQYFYSLNTIWLQLSRAGLMQGGLKGGE
ncbi:hypothetical protein ACQP3L_32940, partial [Escherichia coli]